MRSSLPPEPRFSTHLEVTHSPGRCPIGYSFDNPPIARRLHMCDPPPYRHAQTGDVVDVVESGGPLGIVFEFVAPHPPGEALVVDGG